MKSRVLILVACISFVAVAVLAHGGEEHVIGMVAKVTLDSITVQTTTSKAVTVAVAPETKFIKAKQAAKIGDLRVGDRVVIHAKEVSEGHLVADTVEFAAAAPRQEPQAGTLTGVVSDAMCGSKHSMANMSAAGCARMCVKGGQAYALVAGDKVYTLQRHTAELDKYAGQKVTLTGKLNDNTLTLDSIATAR